MQRDHNYKVDIPPAIKAKITSFANAVEEEAFAGAAPKEDRKAIEAETNAARYDLERTIETYIRRARFGKR